MNTPTTSIAPAQSPAPAPLRLRDALTLEGRATDDDVHTALHELPTSAACDGCRHGDSDGRGHFACQSYHPAWDIAEEIGLADAYLDGSSWVWSLA